MHVIFAGSIALSFALVHPIAAFSGEWLSHSRHLKTPASALSQRSPVLLHRTVRNGSTRLQSQARIDQNTNKDIAFNDISVSASKDWETLWRQVPATPIATGKAGPSTSQLMEKMKGDSIPWVASALMTLPFAYNSHSALPAVIVAVIDLIWYIYSCAQAQRMNTPAKPEPISRDLLELWTKCLTESPDGPEDFVVGWFYDAPLATLAREDIENWLAWGCFSATWESLVPESRSEVMVVLDLIEELLDHRFPLRDKEQAPVPCMRFSIEPFEWTHKPLAYYVVCQGLLGGLGKLSLLNEGFTRYSTGVFDYWLSMPATEEARQRTPIVFVHGIGVGLVMYLSFVKALMKLDCPIVCLELPFISNSIETQVPSISEQVSSVDAICNRWGFEKAVFVGHSYGSLILSWMALHLPTRVAGLAFVDPVVMMLNLKKILFSFLYSNDGGGRISDLIGTEIHVNNALRRNFWWYRNILWASDLQRQRLPTLICLSELDTIVPSDAVRRHIEQHAEKVGEENVVDSYVMQGAFHGDMLFNPKIMDALSERIGAHYVKIEEARSERTVGSVYTGIPRSLENMFGAWEMVLRLQLRWASRRFSVGARVSKLSFDRVIAFARGLLPRSA